MSEAEAMPSWWMAAARCFDRLRGTLPDAAERRAHITTLLHLHACSDAWVPATLAGLHFAQLRSQHPAAGERQGFLLALLDMQVATAGDAPSPAAMLRPGALHAARDPAPAKAPELVESVG